MYRPAKIATAFIVATVLYGSVDRVSAAPTGDTEKSSDFHAIERQLADKDQTIKDLKAQVSALQTQTESAKNKKPEAVANNNTQDTPTDPSGLSKLGKPEIHLLFGHKDEVIAALRKQLSDLKKERDAPATEDPATLTAPIVAKTQTDVPKYHYLKTLEMKLEPSISFSPLSIATNTHGTLFVGVNKEGIRAYDDGVYQGSVGYPDPADAQRAVDAQGVPIEPDEDSLLPRADPILRAKDPSGEDFVLIDDKYSMPVRGHIWQPGAIFVDETTVVVADNFTGTVQVFVGSECKRCISVPPPPGGRDSSGRFTGVALPTVHDLFILDAANNCLIHAYSDAKKPTEVYGFMGTGKSELNGPTSMAVDKGKSELYICDSLNYRVVVFDLHGKYIRSFGSKGTGDGQFTSMYGIAVDKNGRVYVGDKSRIEVFSHEGDYLTQFGPVPDEVTAKSAFGKLINVYGLAVDDNGVVYASDPDGYNIKVYATDQSDKAIHI